ncbi:MAG: class I tRNA ligase family protein, partial [Candidatus Woesearchaeota archaeon]|nr:class I tRNA ligase family protein [Candidatus Woesearchaeota archaeon]
MEIPKHYNPIEEEPKILEFWEKNKVYKFDRKSKKKIYSIDTPPPTVSGKMHIGHAFSYSHQDFIARYKRMKGYNVFYPFGTDDNGLPTERLVESIKNVKGNLMKREDFIKLCLETLEEIRPKYIFDWKRIGTSADFEIYYTTIDEHCRRISQKSFIDLYKKGREYMKEAPALWCPECQTAIAQVEMEDREFTSYFNDLVFKFEDGKELIIATTRPELLPACVAVFVHPDDKRYKKHVGKKVTVPLFNFEVPILTDDKADPEKGTGAVMCCTFGDQTDIYWYMKHNLPLKVAITKDGRMNENAPGYEGLTIEDARKM